MLIIPTQAISGMLGIPISSNIRYVSYPGLEQYQVCQTSLSQQYQVRICYVVIPVSSDIMYIRHPYLSNIRYDMLPYLKHCQAC
jgi:hypothetical protein